MNTTGIADLKLLGNRISICMLLITAFFIFSLIQAPDTYADKMKITGTIKRQTRLARTQIPIPKSPVKGGLTVYHFVLDSTDPDWKDASYFCIVYSASTGEWKNKGYGVVTHPDGEQTFIAIKQKPIGKGSVITSEVKGYFLNGTGKFKGIKGSWNSNWLRDSGREYGLEKWEVEYEIK